MRAAGVSDAAREAFARRFERLVAGDNGAIHGDELEPVRELLSLDELPEPERVITPARQMFVDDLANEPLARKPL